MDEALKNDRRCSGECNECTGYSKLASKARKALEAAKQKIDHALAEKKQVTAIMADLAAELHNNFDPSNFNPWRDQVTDMHRKLSEAREQITLLLAENKKMLQINSQLTVKLWEQAKTKVTLAQKALSENLTSEVVVAFKIAVNAINDVGSSDTTEVLNLMNEVIADLESWGRNNKLQ